MDVMRGYIDECLRVLKPNGVAFLHHSNAAEAATNNHWRSKDGSAAEVYDYIVKRGAIRYPKKSSTGAAAIRWIA